MSTEKLKILLVEDDPNLGTLLQEYLEAKGYETKLGKDGKEGYDLFCKQDYDLILLDVMMPVKDGITLAKEIRMNNKNVPIIFLTAKSMKEDTIEGFNAGGDDYITKPFSMEELLVRIQAVLRRTNKQMSISNEQSNFTLGAYTFNSEKQLLEHNGQQQKLTTKESGLLRLLCVHKNDVLDRNFALKTIWHDDNYFNGRSMDVYIAKLRKYLKDDQKVEIINIHGKGFKLLVNS
ncbi:MAG: response regulator transcription factor [Bacteroidetes bacterium]|jgi:two-component system response regulator VicR|nr:response regulator transcription factor [Bacteroidota bacterium]